jgi:hypothetical protein
LQAIATKHVTRRNKANVFKNKIDITSYMQAAKEVGGDFYDYSLSTVRICFLPSATYREKEWELRFS